MLLCMQHDVTTKLLLERLLAMTDQPFFPLEHPATVAHWEDY